MGRRRPATSHGGSSRHGEEGERRRRGPHKTAAGEADSTLRRKGNAEHSASGASGIAGRMNRLSLASPTGPSRGDRRRNEEKTSGVNLLDLGKASSMVFETGLRAEAKASGHRARESFADWDRGRNEEKIKAGNLLDLGRASSTVFKNDLRANAKGSGHRARESFAIDDRGRNGEKIKADNLLDLGRASSVAADQKIRESERQRKIRGGGMTIHETAAEHGKPQRMTPEQNSVRKMRRKKVTRRAF